jgi:PAS domain-containing protein
MSDLVQKPYILLQGFSIVISVLILIVHSIYTERQEFIVEIRRSEQNLKAVLTNLPLGVGILNSEGEPEFLNKEFSEKTNLYLDDFKSPKVINESRKYEKNAVYFLTNFWKTFIECFSLNENIEKDISILNKHHEAIDFSLNINPLKDRYLLVMMDITQRKKMLNRIKEDERRLSSLIQNLQGMVYQCRFDRNWTMEFVSEGSFLLTGYLPSDFIYNSRIPYASIIDEKYRDYVWDTIESTPASSSRFFITAEG